MPSVKVFCQACGGTGVYCGFAEPKGTGVVCLRCEGSGAQTLSYEPFTGRKRRNDVQYVRLSAGTFLVTGVGPRGTTVSYDEFLQGRMPKRDTP
jgi:hypothetical protein